MAGGDALTQTHVGTIWINAQGGAAQPSLHLLPQPAGRAKGHQRSTGIQEGFGLTSEPTRH
jgi:hypothetical protein